MCGVAISILVFAWHGDQIPPELQSAMPIYQACCLARSRQLLHMLLWRLMKHFAYPPASRFCGSMAENLCMHRLLEPGSLAAVLMTV